MTFSECQSNRRRQDLLLLLLLWSQIEHRLICIAESRERYDEQDEVEEEVKVEEEVASIAGTISSSSGAQAQRRWQEIKGAGTGRAPLCKRIHAMPTRRLKVPSPQSTKSASK